MRGSLRLARIFGIDVRVHFTFGFLLAFVAFEYAQRHGSRGALFGVLSVVCLFACVTLHELGHSLVGRRFGADVREIVLLPIGGMARMTREPTRPLHELLIAIAGPAVNVVIALALLVALGLHLDRVPDEATLLAAVETPGPKALLLGLIMGNIWLALFNMIPALPMDGGRVLRAVLSFGMGKGRATTIAAAVGQVLAVGFAAFGVMGNQPILMLIGVFIFFAAGQEKVSARAGEILSQLSAGELCHPAAEHLLPTDDLGDVVDHALRSGQSIYPVVNETDLFGIVLRDEAIEAAARLGLRASVSHVLRRELPIFDTAAPLTLVRDRIGETGLPAVIVDGHRFVGVLGREDIARITQLASRLSSAGIRRPAPATTEAAGVSRSV